MKSGKIISAAAAAMVFLSMSLAVFAVPPPTATLIPAPREMCVTGGEYWAKKPPKMEKVEGIPSEGYELSIRPDGMTIRYSDDATGVLLTSLARATRIRLTASAGSCGRRRNTTQR